MPVGPARKEPVGVARGHNGQAGRPGCRCILAERGKSMLTGKLSWGEEDGAVVHIKAPLNIQD